jgi:tetratricopeptide (TPR) repeat protein
MRSFRVTVLQSGSPAISVTTCILLVVATLTSIPSRGQAAQNAPGSLATLQGSVRDSAGRPIAGASVYLQLKEDPQTLSAHADAAGKYRFSGLREGIYVLRVEMAGYSRATIGSCVLGSNETKSLDLTLGAGSQAQNSSSDKPGSAKPDAEKPEFFDEPQFTVAGVTDGTNLGGHGSNTIVRTKESLAKDITSLGGVEKPMEAGRPRPSSINPAEASLRAAAERQPEDFDANHRLGKVLIEDGEAADAIRYLERASQLKPGDYENSYLLALAYGDAGQYQHAETNARALLTIQEKDRAQFAQKDQAELHHLLGDIEEKSGDPLESVREYQRATELNPSESDFFDWGTELLLHRAAEPAIEVFSKGNRLFPQSARMLVALGVAWYSNGSYDQAAQRLCEASDMNPADPKPYLFLGKIQSVETNQSECSAERLKRFAMLQPENALAHYYYGVHLWKRRKGPDDAGALTLAESELKRAVQIDPTLGAGYLQLGILYSEQNDFSRAISSYEQAIHASPQLEEAHYRLAQAYKRTGEKGKAETEYRLYNQLSKSKDEEVERERRESRQFVYTLRSPAAGAESR